MARLEESIGETGHTGARPAVIGREAGDRMVVETETRTTIAASVVTLCAFVGPAHIMVRVNEAWRERFGEPAIGVPVREAYTDPVWKPLQTLMDEVYRTRQERCLPWAEGVAVFTPVSAAGLRGVVAALYLPAPPLRTPGGPLRPWLVASVAH